MDNIPSNLLDTIYDALRTINAYSSTDDLKAIVGLGQDKFQRYQIAQQMNADYTRAILVHNLQYFRDTYNMDIEFSHSGYKIHIDGDLFASIEPNYHRSFFADVTLERARLCGYGDMQQYLRNAEIVAKIANQVNVWIHHCVVIAMEAAYNKDCNK